MSEPTHDQVTAGGEAVRELGKALIRTASEVELDNTKGLDGLAILSGGFHFAIQVINDTLDPTFKARLIRTLQAGTPMQ